MITMKLLEKKILMNHKKVLRITKKYNLLSKVRKKKPYKDIAKITQEHRYCNNILNRDFRWLKAFSKLWTDISYLYYNWTKAYISILKDMITWEIISHKLSNNLWLWFVIDTIKTVKIESDNLIIQSDQWWHYTHSVYIKLLKDRKIIQSMSRKCALNEVKKYSWDEIDYIMLLMNLFFDI